jgi:putative iron-dependent peroxidase
MEVFMPQPQTAIIPNAGQFALYAQIKVKNNEQKVLEALQSLPELVNETNNNQPNANLTQSIAFSASFWKKLNKPAPSELVEFPELKTGPIVAPSTDVDVLIHLHSERHDLHFYVFRKFLAAVEGCIDVVDESNAFRYLDSRDMTDFVDGTENPKTDEDRSEVALIPEGDFQGGSYVMVQKFVHNLPAWNKLSVQQQELKVGRTKPDSVELDDVPAQSHVGRVDIKEEGKGLKIVRHSLPFGQASGEHGLLFIAYCSTVYNFTQMLESMYGIKDGKVDHLLYFTKATTGAYFFAPSLEDLQDLKVA